MLKIVKLCSCGTKSSYVGKNLLTKFTMQRCEGRKSRRKCSDSLRYPFTEQRIIKYSGFESIPIQSIHFFLLFKVFGFVVQSGRFRPLNRLFVRCKHENKGRYQKSPDSSWIPNFCSSIDSLMSWMARSLLHVGRFLRLTREQKQTDWRDCVVNW